MQVNSYIFQSPYSSQVQVGRPDPSVKREDDTQKQSQDTQKETTQQQTTQKASIKEST